MDSILPFQSLENLKTVNSNETKTITKDLFLPDFVYDETNKTKYYDTRETKKIFSKIKRNDLSIFHFNARSLKKIKTKLKNFSMKLITYLKLLLFLNQILRAPQ